MDGVQMFLSEPALARGSIFGTIKKKQNEKIPGELNNKAFYFRVSILV